MPDPMGIFPNFYNIDSNYFKYLYAYTIYILYVKSRLRRLSIKF